MLVAAGCGSAYFLLYFAAICIRKLLICLNTLRVPVNSKPVTHPIQTLNAVIQITETFNSARKSWLKWAHEHVEVVWFTSWSPRN
jgi:hypothetical protein